MLNDLRFALRALVRNPGFTVVAVVTLALGIGANTALFSIADAVLLQPLPYPEPDRIVQIDGAPFRFTNTGMTASPRMESSPQFAGVGMYATGGLNVGGGTHAERVVAAAVSAGFFQAMGAAPVVGRPFTAAEAAANERVAVIGLGLWRRRFNGSPRLDQPLDLNGQMYTVVGVMPRRYGFPDDAEVWVPPGVDRQITGSAFAPSTVARLAPGVSLAQAKAEVERIKYDGQPPDPRDREVVVMPLRERLVGSVRPLFGVIAAGALLVLLVACINTANLLLARVSARERELSVRRALGASRLRLMRFLLSEAALISALAGLSAVPIAILTLSAMRTVLPGALHGVADISIDMRAAVATAVLCVASAVLFGLAPALSVRGRSTASLLRGGSATTGVTAQRVRGVLVAAEIAASLVLLAASVTVMKTVTSLMRVDLGARGENVLTLQLTLPLGRYDTQDKVREFSRGLEERLRALEGVEAVGVTTMMPGSREVGSGIRMDIQGLTPNEAERSTLLLRASDDYFTAMGIDLVAGRHFTAADRSGAPAVIVSDAVAHAFGVEPPQLLGRRMRADFGKVPVYADIVGVVRGVRMSGPEGTPGAQLYRPFSQSPGFGTLYLAVKTAGAPLRLSADLRAALTAIDPDLPPYNVRTFDDIRASYLGERRFARTVMAGFALLTAVLAAIGLYGVVSYLVQQRTREIGVRVALGASPHVILRETLRTGLLYGVTGIVAGAAATAVLSRVFISRVPGLQQVDTLTLTTTAALMLTLTALTTLVPARRAAGVDPVEALRRE